MWEDGNNLTSNLFTLITSLTTHKNTSDICSYKPYTQKEQINKIYKNCCDMESRSQVQEHQQKHSKHLSKK